MLAVTIETATGFTYINTFSRLCESTCVIKPTVQLIKPGMQSHFYQIFECPLGDQADPSSYFVCELIFIITSN